ncbi:hypothetical protein ACFSQ7_40690 [Paenibacillus rhizoplanae]
MAAGHGKNYADRKSAAFVGVYESTVEQQHVPYILPVECGGKEDVRYLYLSSEEQAVKSIGSGTFPF